MCAARRLLRAPFFERCIIQKRVGLRRKNSAGKSGRLQRVHRYLFDFTAVQFADDIEKAIHIHRLGQAIFDRLLNKRMIGHRQITGGKRFSARVHLGIRGVEEIIGAHPDDGSRDTFSGAHPFEQKRTLQIPSPTRRKHRRGQKRLDQNIACRVGMQIAKHFIKRKTVLRSEGQNDGFFVGCRLQFKTKSAAESFAEGQSPGPIDAAAKGRMNDKLHASALIKESLRYYAGLGWHGAQHLLAFLYIVHNLRLVRIQIFAQLCDGCGELAGAARRFTQPEGKRGGWPLASATRTMPG